MVISHEMRLLSNAVPSDPDRFGGLPSHLPPEFPKCDVGNHPLSFLMQLYMDRERLPIEGLLCIQIYECVTWKPGSVHTGVPVAVAVPLGSPRNEQGLGVGLVEDRDMLGGPTKILWTNYEEPDLPPEISTGDWRVGNVLKAGGHCSFGDQLPEGSRYLFQLTDAWNIGCNFAGGTLVVFLNRAGTLESRLFWPPTPRKTGIE